MPRATPNSRLQAILDARRIMRWIYIGRLAVATSILLAAVFSWERAEPSDTLAATLIFAVTAVVTAGSAMYSEIYRRPVGREFRAGQTVFDLLLVTAVVHVTGGSASQFAALYILVIACASLLLNGFGGPIIALAGCTLYFADVILGHSTPLDVSVVLQLLVFAAAAVGSGYISARLQEAGAGTRQLAAELVKARLQAADILENIRSGVLTVDAGGHLLFANPAAEALLGTELEHRIGTPVLAEIGRIAPGLADALVRALSAQVRTTRAEAVVDRSEHPFTIGVTTTFTKGDGTPAGMTATAIFSDISDQLRVDSLRIRAGRLEAVAELSASLAHEIKNPLASIRSAVEQLARMPAMSSADEDATTLSTLIVRESDRLARLLSEFLDFARVRVTRIDRVDLGAIARDAANLAAAHPDRGESVEVACTTPPDPLIIDGDTDLLHRAAFNLALNAVQAAPPSGRVSIEVVPLLPDQVPVGISFERGAVALRVTDDGPGIPPEARERLFTPFFTTKPGGTGLGLPVVHRAIEAHRGVVFVDTAAGKGTRFTVVLPLVQDDEQGRGTRDEGRERPRSRTPSRTPSHTPSRKPSRTPYPSRAI